MSANPVDGMWYPCQIEKVINNEKDSKDLSNELKAMLMKYQIKFKHPQLQTKVTVPLDYLRLTKEHLVLNQKKKQQLSNAGMDGNDQVIGEFQIPENLRTKRSDTEKERLQKRKKVKALKYNYKQKILDQESKNRQNVWQDFTNKAVKQKAGHFAMKQNMESIFKSPDTIMGKVGVVGSGQQMTSYDINKIKY